MCGIAGIVYKDKKLHDIGTDMTKMLHALQHRGPDSAGMALYGGMGLEENEYVLNIQVDNKKGLLDIVKDELSAETPILDEETFHSNESSDEESFVYRVKIALNDFKELKPLITKLDKIDDVIVLNGSNSFEMIKDIGSVLDISQQYGVKYIKGTHGIGHTRFATESNVDRYHAHPFQTYIVKDITVVHNGQITNYWKIRDPLERKGHIFETTNDTECLVHYIADKLDSGFSLEDALKQSVQDMDGPFSFIIGTPQGIGIAKDRLGLRPGVMAENDEIFAIASEEVSLREVMDVNEVEQIEPGQVRVYEI
ncbi:MAG: glutamine amidotransferase [Methanobrevibacter sp.]|jgi:glutamate synthase domain-containing protein 1|nr:glutamine amidotransferase [Candidatus Methanoflexus mossambicus]